MSEEVQVWRITDKKHSDSAFTGKGAKLWGGRFNSPGIPAVYASGSLSLALLETLVQTNSRLNLKKKVLIRATIPGDLIYAPSKDSLPGRWNHIPAAKASQDYGNDCLKDTMFPVLKIPSVVIPIEYNYVINPIHHLFHRIDIGDMESIPLDPRFFEG